MITKSHSQCNVLPDLSDDSGVEVLRRFACSRVSHSCLVSE